MPVIEKFECTRCPPTGVCIHCAGVGYILRETAWKWRRVERSEPQAVATPKEPVAVPDLKYADKSVMEAAGITHALAAYFEGLARAYDDCGKPEKAAEVRQDRLELHRALITVNKSLDLRWSKIPDESE